MTQLTLELVTPSGLRFSEEIYEALLPTKEGQIAILPHHIPLVTLVVPGVASVRKRALDSDANLEHFALSGGLVEVDGQRIRILADSAEHADDIDELKAKEAAERAREMMQKAKNEVSLAEATATLERNLARLKVAELKRRRRKL